MEGPKYQTNDTVLSLRMRTDIASVTVPQQGCVVGKQKEGLSDSGYNRMASARADETNANKMINY